MYQKSLVVLLVLMLGSISTVNSQPLQLQLDIVSYTDLEKNGKELTINKILRSINTTINRIIRDMKELRKYERLIKNEATDGKSLLTETYALYKWLQAEVNNKSTQNQAKLNILMSLPFFRQKYRDLFDQNEIAFRQMQKHIDAFPESIILAPTGDKGDNLLALWTVHLQLMKYHSKEVENHFQIEKYMSLRGYSPNFLF